MPKSKVSAFFSVLVVILSGAAMGAVGYRLYAVKSVSTPTNPPPPTKKSPEEVRKLLISSLKDKVRLDDLQLVEVQKIYQEQREAFDEMNARYHARLDPIIAAATAEREQIHEAYVAKIKALLRPDQVTLYEKWQADRAAAQKRREQEQQRDHPDGKRPDGKRRPPIQLPPLP